MSNTVIDNLLNQINTRILCSWAELHHEERWENFVNYAIKLNLFLPGRSKRKMIESIIHLGLYGHYFTSSNGLTILGFIQLSTKKKITLLGHVLVNGNPILKKDGEKLSFKDFVEEYTSVQEAFTEDDKKGILLYEKKLKEHVKSFIRDYGKYLK